MATLLGAIAGVFTGLRELTREARGIRIALEELVELRRLELQGVMQQPGAPFRSGYEAGPEVEGSVMSTDNDSYAQLAEIRDRCRSEGLPAPELDEDLAALARHRGWL